MAKFPCSSPIGGIQAVFPASAITALYFRRWVVETHDHDEKTSRDIQTFHGQTEITSNI